MVVSLGHRAALRFRVSPLDFVVNRLADVSSCYGFRCWFRYPHQTTFPPCRLFSSSKQLLKCRLLFHSSERVYRVAAISTAHLRSLFPLVTSRDVLLVSCRWSKLFRRSQAIVVLGDFVGIACCPSHPDIESTTALHAVLGCHPFENRLSV